MLLGYGKCSNNDEIKIKINEYLKINKIASPVQRQMKEHAKTGLRFIEHNVIIPNSSAFKY